MTNPWVPAAWTPLVTVIFIATLIVHVACALGVLLDGRFMPERRRALMHPLVWALAALLGGVFVGAVYWFLHHSSTFAENTREVGRDRMGPPTID